MLSPRPHAFVRWRALAASSIGLVAAIVGVFIPEQLAAEPALASPLSSATVDRVVNLVTVELLQQPPQPAAIHDVLVPEDLLHTGQTSLAQMLFNDDSLVRVGQNSTFTFAPETRQFQLDAGVMMMITPPGAGGAEVITPTAIAGVQGSLLTVTARLREDGKQTALISSFTSPAELFNRDRQVIGQLNPRQMALVVDGEVVAIANFNACATVSGSPILQGLAKNHDLSGESSRAAQTIHMEREILHNQVACTDSLEIVDRPEIDIFVPTHSDNEQPEVEPPPIIDVPQTSPTVPELVIDEEPRDTSVDGGQQDPNR